MASFAITITNSVRVFGQSPATRWGNAFGSPYTMTWGTTKWGEGSVTMLYNFVYSKLWSENIQVTGTYGSLQTFKFLTIDFPITHNMGTENLRDGSNQWSYVFVSNTENAEIRNISSFTSLASGRSTTFSCFPAGSTIWS